MLLTESMPAPAASVLLTIMALFDWFELVIRPVASFAPDMSGDLVMEVMV